MFESSDRNHREGGIVREGGRRGGGGGGGGGGRGGGGGGGGQGGCSEDPRGMEGWEEQSPIANNHHQSRKMITHDIKV